MRSGDEVEVRRKNAWYEATVVRSMPRLRRYTVSYSDDSVREDVEWTEVRPRKAKALGFKFKKGAIVEISSDEEGFGGAWFAATVIKCFGNNNRFLVEYRDICKSTTEDEKLQEMVDSLHIRPLPPTTTIALENLELLEEVDALHQDAWWVGLICNIISDTNYVVFFRHTNETILFQRHQLRPHYDFIAGNWIRASHALLGL